MWSLGNKTFYRSLNPIILLINRFPTDLWQKPFNKVWPTFCDKLYVVYWNFECLQKKREKIESNNLFAQPFFEMDFLSENIKIFVLGIVNYVRVVWRLPSNNRVILQWKLNAENIIL